MKAIASRILTVALLAGCAHSIQAADPAPPLTTPHAESKAVHPGNKMEVLAPAADADDDPADNATRLQRAKVRYENVVGSMAEDEARWRVRLQEILDAVDQILRERGLEPIEAIAPAPLKPAPPIKVDPTATVTATAASTAAPPAQNAAEDNTDATPPLDPFAARRAEIAQQCEAMAESLRRFADELRHSINRPPNKE